MLLKLLNAKTAIRICQRTAAYFYYDSLLLHFLPPPNLQPFFKIGYVKPLMLISAAGAQRTPAVRVPLKPAGCTAQDIE
jgi:hypothetical protein